MEIVNAQEPAVKTIWELADMHGTASDSNHDGKTTYEFDRKALLSFLKTVQREPLAALKRIVDEAAEARKGSRASDHDHENFPWVDYSEIADSDINHAKTVYEQSQALLEAA
ncbi:MAG: hypothetical protein ACTS9Y_00350 [Methylophilus sp.]|uniref:hypothetical protein n=1 Tax=Methylophilus sp. TaxID=29541 RepID=UPI003F9F5529